MQWYAKFLQRKHVQDTQMAATLTQLELPNLMALLTEVERAGQAEAIIGLCTNLYLLLQNLGRPHLLHRVAAARNTAQAALGEGWSHASFVTEFTRAEQLWAQGNLQEALRSSYALRQHAQSAGEAAYEQADYDWALACALIGRILQSAGMAGDALAMLKEAQQRFEDVEATQPGCGAADMISVCITDAGNCLKNLGQLDEAATAYERAIQLDEARQAHRDVAVGKSQLGTVRLLQRRYADALAAYEGARRTFESLGEPGTVAKIWCQPKVEMSPEWPK